MGNFVHWEFGRLKVPAVYAPASHQIRHATKRHVSYQLVKYTVLTKDSVPPCDAVTLRQSAKLRMASLLTRNIMLEGAAGMKWS